MRSCSFQMQQYSYIWNDLIKFRFILNFIHPIYVILIVIDHEHWNEWFCFTNFMCWKNLRATNWNAPTYAIRNWNQSNRKHSNHPRISSDQFGFKAIQTVNLLLSNCPLYKRSKRSLPIVCTTIALSRFIAFMGLSANITLWTFIGEQNSPDSLIFPKHSLVYYHQLLTYFNANQKILCFFR